MEQASSVFVIEGAVGATLAGRALETSCDFHFAVDPAETKGAFKLKLAKSGSLTPGKPPETDLAFERDGSVMEEIETLR